MVRILRGVLRRKTQLLGWGVLLCVIGTKLGLIHFYGTDQPFADQWAAEGVGFLQAPLHGGLNWSSFFWPHGEHRPAITRLITRALIVSNEGQWDCYVEIVANLLIYAALLAVAWRIVLQVTLNRWLGVVAFFMAIVFSAPCAYENLLWGFQSQFTFMLFCGMLHIYASVSSPIVGGRWALAQFVGFCGIFSIASGMISAVSLAILATVEILRGRRDPWSWCTLTVNLALSVYGLWLLPKGTASSGLTVDHLSDVILRTGYLLSWPLSGFWWCLLLQLPWLITFAGWCWKCGGATRDRLLPVLGIWVSLVAVTVGYGRVLTPDTIGVRYYDVFLVGIFVNGLAAAWLFSQTVWLPRQLSRVVGIGWAIAFAVGFWNFNNPEFSGAMLRQQKEIAIEQKGILNKFMVSDDVAPLIAFNDRTHRFPHFQLTLLLLRDSQVRPLLAPSLSTDSRIGWLSRFSRQISNSWTFVTIAGLALLVVAALGFYVPKPDAELMKVKNPA